MGVHILVGKEGLEPSIRKERDFESRAYTIPPLALKTKKELSSQVGDKG